MRARRDNSPQMALWLLIGLQGLLILIDSTPRYLFADSAYYLWGVDHGGPVDRSWTYPAWVLTPLFAFESMHAIVRAQCALAVIPPILCWRLLADEGHSRAWVPLAFAAIAALEPLALAYPHYILADGVAAVTVAGALYFCARLLDGKPYDVGSAALAPALMVLAASWRSSYLPALAVMAVATVAVLVVRRRFVAAAMFVASLAALHVSFSDNNLERQGAPGYNAASGRYLLAAMLPIVTKEDVAPFVDPKRVPALFDAHARDRRLRPLEMWNEGFAGDQIRSVSGNLNAESALSSKIALHAMQRDPLAAAELGFATWFDYFDPPFIQRRVEIEAGYTTFSSYDLAYLKENGITDVEDTSKTPSLAYSWFRALWFYYGLIPALGVALLAGAIVVDRTPSTLALAAFSVVNSATHILLSTEPVPRYLIISAWVNIVVLGRIALVLMARRSEARKPALGKVQAKGFTGQRAPG